MRKIITLLLIIAVVSSCTQRNVKNIQVKDVVLTAEGPYFEGPNAFQARLNNTLKDNGIMAENLNKIELLSATILLPDSFDDGLIQDISLQLLSNSSKIKKVAFINPLKSNEKKVPLTVAQEQEDLADLFSKDEVIVLLDANFSKDYELPITFTANLVFNVTTQ